MIVEILIGALVIVTLSALIGSIMYASYETIKYTKDHKK